MEENLVSSHQLNMSSYEGKGKWRGVIQGWVAFLAVYIVTRIPAVQQAMTGFAESMHVDWVTSMVNFLINGFIYISILLAIGTFMIWRKKQLFTEVRIYEDGIGFVIDGKEQRVPFENVLFDYGKMQKSVCIECGVLGISMGNYYWTEFTQGDVMEKNLQRYANWGINKYKSK